MRHMLHELNGINRNLQQREDDDVVQEEWNLVCFRLDIIAMVVSHAANIAMMAFWMCLEYFASQGTLENHFDA